MAIRNFKLLNEGFSNDTIAYTLINLDDNVVVDRGNVRLGDAVYLQYDDTKNNILIIYEATNPEICGLIQLE